VLRRLGPETVRRRRVIGAGAYTIGWIWAESGHQRLQKKTEL